MKKFDLILTELPPYISCLGCCENSKLLMCKQANIVPTFKGAHSTMTLEAKTKRNFQPVSGPVIPNLGITTPWGIVAHIHGHHGTCTDQAAGRMRGTQHAEVQSSRLGCMQSHRRAQLPSLVHTSAH